MSRKEWESIGKKAGWMTKTADISGDFSDINNLTSEIERILSHGKFMGHDFGANFGRNPQYYEDDETMREEVREAEALINQFIAALSNIGPKLEKAKEALMNLKYEYGLVDQDDVPVVEETTPEI